MMKTLSTVFSHLSVRRARGFFKHFAITAFALSSAVHGTTVHETNEENVNLLSPQEQLKKFKLAPGFEIELVACEAMGTKKIVDVAFDTQGRMWACTASEYPADAFGVKTNFGQMLRKQGVQPSQRVMDLWEKGGIDEVLVFPNPTAQKPNKPILFGGGRALPMGVLPYKNGAIVIEGPRLLFLEDTNNDGMADKKTVLAEGFGAQDTHTGAHGLKYMPGDWVTISNGVLCWGDIIDRDGKVTRFDRSGIAYIRPDGRDFHLSTTGFQNIWGFYLGKNGQVWMHEANNVGYPLAPYYERTAYPMTTSRKDFYREYMHAFPPSVGPGDKRVDLEGSALSGLERSDDLVNGFPKEWQDRFLIAHPMPRKIHSMTASKRPDESYEVLRGPDLLSCDDPNFRPVDIEFGPDGCLYIVDWYNPIISHNEVARDDPRRNKTETRIWRVRHESQKKYPKPANIRKASTKELLTYLASKNSWEQESAWKELAERQDRGAIPQLVEMALSQSQIERNRIHAIWSLESLRHFDVKVWQALLDDQNVYIRTEAARSLRHVQPDLELTFPLLRALAKKEKAFAVTKQILHYMADAKSLNAAHIDWLMQWRSKVPVKNLPGKYISHVTPNWETYKPNHFQDLVRIALEAHPDQLIAYLQDGNHPKENRDFISKLVVPQLDQRYALLAAGNLSSDDLKDLKTRTLVFAGLKSAKFKALAEGYLSGQTPRQRMVELIGSGVEPSPELNQLLLPAFAELLKSKAAEDQKAYLQGSIYTGKLNGMSGEEDVVRYLDRIKASHPDLLPLAISALTRIELKLFSVYKSLAEQDSLSKTSRHYAYLGALLHADQEQSADLIASLRAYASKLEVGEKQKLHVILAEKRKPLAALFVTLDKTGQKEIDASYDFFRFIQERYQMLVEPTALHKMAGRGYERISKGLESASQVKDGKARLARWEKVAKDASAGDATKGAVLFRALCLSCHNYQGEGQGLGPGLDGTGNRPLEGLLTAIVLPDEGVESVYRKTHIQYHNGQHLTGLLKYEDNAMHLYQMGGGKMKIFQGDVAYIHTSQRSFMPAYITSGMQDEQVADLLKYLRSMK
ncbi:MAG: DUF7133 domain-containing protein [Luteolibacter sp.]